MSQTREYKRAYREANRESILAKKRAYREANRETLRRKAAAYYAANKQDILAREAAARAANIEAERLKDQAYRADHKDTIYANARVRRRVRRDILRLQAARAYSRHCDSIKRRVKAYRKANPAMVAALHARRRAHKAGAPRNDLTRAQWAEIQGAQDHRCYYCGKRCKGKLTQDHIMPLSQGGSHTLHNVIGACRSCNSKKHAGAPPIAVQPLLLTIAPARKKNAS